MFAPQYRVQQRKPVWQLHSNTTSSNKTRLLRLRKLDGNTSPAIPKLRWGISSLFVTLLGLGTAFAESEAKAHRFSLFVGVDGWVFTRCFVVVFLY